MIRFDHVSFAFGGRPVVDDLSFTLPDGGLLLLTGANGAGKSTVVRLVLGLLVPDSGTIEGAGRPAAAVFQEDRLCDQLGAFGNLRLVLGRRIGDDQILAGLAAAGLAPADLDRPVGRLSGGQRRRVALARALLAAGEDPRSIVCLDEPFTGLDRGVRSSSSPSAGLPPVLAGPSPLPPDPASVEAGPGGPSPCPPVDPASSPAPDEPLLAWVRARIAGHDTILVTHSPREAAAFPGHVLRLAPPRR